MTTTLPIDRATDTARRWLEVDPDPDTRAETEQLLTDGGEELEHRFGDRLTFGTAGLRGPLGAGPMRMNRVLVRMTAAAIGRRLLAGARGPAEDGDSPLLVVVGFDARHKSDVFAQDTARVLAGLGIASLVLPRPLPTPLLAFTLRDVGADAAIMVTASHNPREDNGYKVYWSDGAQIIPPIDAEISTAIDEVPLPTDADLTAPDHPLIGRAGEAEVDRYVTAAATVVQPGSPPSVSVVYSAMHGVGRDVVLAAFRRAGFRAPSVVAAQGDPDPDFPTVEYPNPELPGALDLAIAQATAEHADLILANDPDADRLAVVVPDGLSWRTLTGDEVGALLADHMLTVTEGSDRLVVTTVVSSRLLADIARHHAVGFAETLTGFKWIVRPGLADPTARFVFGYEQAIGYAVSDMVRDKDGITAALLFTELATTELAAGRSVIDRLHDLWRRHGVHRTGLRSLRFDEPDGAQRIEGVLARIRRSPPAAVGGRDVVSMTDLAQPGTSLPPTNALVFDLAGGRIVIRPSGTEPLLKVYAEVIESPTDDDPRSSERAGDLAVVEMLDAVDAMLKRSSR